MNGTVRATHGDGTVDYYGELLGFDATVETCPMCGKVARKVAIIRETDGTEVRAAGKCARYLLGYDPFTTSS